uniref:Uncharacterized protein n=1 Tax=Panagrolaimus superbus TaxID=310955 RepID=A0A914XXH1_9BILA
MFIFLTLLLEHVLAPEIEEEIYHYRPSFGLTKNGKPILRELAIIPSNIDIKLMDKMDDEDEESDPERIGTIIWQLFNHCSNGFLQMNVTVNTRGTTSSPCNTILLSALKAPALSYFGMH